MAGYRIVSADDHVFEPADLWTSRMEPKFRDRAPHVVRREEDHSDWWYCDGAKGVSGGSGGSQAGARFDQPETLSFAGSFEDIYPGGYIPEEHIKDMDTDGLDVSILYPTEGLFLFHVQDSELLNAIFRTYNDWIAEHCSSFPRRLKGIGMLNIDDVPRV